VLKRRFPRGVKALFRPFGENWKLSWLGYVSIVLFVVGLSALTMVAVKMQS
jgi:hypothetical protein